MQKKKFKIVIDTNIWISLMFKGQANEMFFELLGNKNITIYSNDELRTEILETANNVDIIKYLNDKNAPKKLMKIFDTKCKKINQSSIVKVVKEDPDDDFLFALSKDAKADYLITYNKHCLSILQFKKTKVISLPEFMNILRNELN